MAQTDHLPIYRRTYDLCLHLEQVVRSFPRYQKYSLGTDLRGAARRALSLVVRANSRRDKTSVLLELRETLEELKALLRLCQDVRAFPRFVSYEHAMLLLVDAAKQNEGWLRSQRGQGDAPGRPGAVAGQGQDRRTAPGSGTVAPSVP